jgi:ribonuclease R
MLPHNLSDDICSINPNVLRMAITCDMIINTQGTFDDIKVYPSIIKSHRRYSYDEVNEFVEGKTKLENDEIAVVESIKTGLELSKVLSAYKEKRGYIDFHIPEPIIKVNEKCEPIEIISKVQGVAQKMIEDFMVAANEAVTIFADKMNYPFIYRIHDKPDEDRIKTFALEAKKLGFRITTSIDDVKPTDVEK